MSLSVIEPAGYEGNHVTKALNNWIKYIHNKGNAVCSVAVLFVIATIILRSIQEAYFTLPSFDGAMNLQVPVNLIKYGRYATSYNAIIDFDHRIQSGFPFLLPIYFMFLVFGTSAFTAQLVNSIYMILVAVVIYRLTAINTNRVFALIVLVLFMLTPFLLEYGNHIYGEIPALFYLLSSLLLLCRLESSPDDAGMVLPFFVGFLYGLSYLTKTVMLIAVPSIIIVFLIDLLIMHKLKLKHYICMLIGFILPILAFEGYKVMQLGAAEHHEWWKTQSNAIMPHVGVMERYEDTATVYMKMLVHTKQFCKFFHMNKAVMLCFLCVPQLIFAGSFFYCFIKKRRDQLHVALAIVCGTACTYMVWWIFMTPTARAWPRRIINGYILQEIVLVFSAYVLWKFLSTTACRIRSLKKMVGGIVFIVLLFVIAWQGAVNINHFQFLFKPSQEKLDAEIVARNIDALPQSAQIFGYGWWQAPILSFLSSRMFLDINNHRLPSFPVKLEDTYVVIDYPEALDYVDRLVLKKTQNRLIEKRGYNYLYQIEYKTIRAML